METKINILHLFSFPGTSLFPSISKLKHEKRVFGLSKAHFWSNFVKFYPISFLLMWFSMENKLIEQGEVKTQG